MFSTWLKSELKKRGCSSAQINSKVVTTINEVLCNETGADLLKRAESDFRINIHNIIHEQVNASYAITKEAIEILNKKFDELHREIDNRVKEIEISTNLLEQNLAKMREFDKKVSQIGDELNRIEELSPQVTEEINAIRKHLSDVDISYEELRKSSSVTNDGMREALAFQRDMLKNTLDILKENFNNLAITPDVMSSAIQASSYATWRGLDPKNMAITNNFDSSNNRRIR
jgi:chromosome segregation ATPase